MDGESVEVDLLDGLVVKSLPSSAENVGSSPSRGAKMPQNSQPKKNQNIKQKQHCNKFNQDFKKQEKELREESDTTERLHFHFSLSCIGEGNGNPLQCSCLENPRDGGAWWARLWGHTESDTTEVT